MAKNIVKAAGLLLAVNVFVKVLGFVREMVIAAAFGATATTDAYLVAYTIPYFLQAILGYAFVSAVLPVFSRYWQADGNNAEAFRIGSTLINLVAIVMAALSLLGIVAAPLLVRLTAPALAADTSALAVQLTRVIFPSLLFMSLGMVASGILNSRYRFVAAALAPGLVSISIIITTACLAKGNIYIVALGTLVGFVAFFLLQAFDLPRAGFRYQLALDIKHPAIRRVLREILPIVLGLAVNQVYTLLNRVFASGLAEGSISILNYAAKLMNLPLGVFVAAIITAVFPALADQARNKDTAPLAATVSRGMSMSLLLILPAAGGLMLLSAPIVELLFESGSFDAATTAATAQALFAMCPGMVFLGISMLLIRVFYALSDVKTPLLAGAVSIAVNVLASLLLVKQHTYVGLAWANSVAAAVNALGLWWPLSRRIGFCDRYLKHNMLRIALATCAMAIVCALLFALWPAPYGKAALAMQIAVLLVISVAVYFVVLRLLRTRALADIWRELFRREK